MENYQSEDPLFITVLIYLFLTELAIGTIQLIGALIRTLILLSKNKPLGKLKTYWIMVLIYLIGMAAIYYGQQLMLSNLFIANSSSTTINSNGMCIIYFVYGYITWIALAWLIAIWYAVVIVFNKTFTQLFFNSKTL